MFYSNWDYKHYQDNRYQRRFRRPKSFQGTVRPKEPLPPSSGSSKFSKKNVGIRLFLIKLIDLNKIRRVIYLTLFTVCFGFFVYFMNDFWLQYKQYPMIINVEVLFPTEVTIPAVSACYNHPIRRSEACKMKKYIERCRNNEKLDLIDTIKNATTEEFKQMRHVPESLFKFFNVTGNGGFVEQNIHLNSTWSHRELYSCFTANERWSSSPLRTAKNVKDFLYYFFQVVMNPNETLGKVRTRQGTVFVHSPFAIPFETEAKIRVSPGYLYEVKVAQSRILLLEPPYKTACRNYSRAWMNDKTIPYLGRYNCIIDCRTRRLMKQCNCVPARAQVVTDGVKKCVGDFSHCYNDEFAKTLDTCADECPNRCDLDVYEITSSRFKLTDVTEMFQCIDDFCTKFKNSEDSVVVQVYVQTSRQLLFNHTPKLQTMEIFGFIGGYLGIWLGLSIPQIYKLFEHYLFLGFYRCVNKQKEFVSIK